MDRPDLNPKSWGPPAWAFLDSVLQSFPANALLHDRLWMIEFLTSLADALPCTRCRENYRNFLQRNPVQGYVGGRAEIQGWLNAYKMWSKSM